MRDASRVQGIGVIDESGGVLLALWARLDRLAASAKGQRRADLLAERNAVGVAMRAASRG